MQGERLVTGDERAAWYGATAVSRAVASVMNAADHTRNATLNREAFVLGRLVGAGILDESHVGAALLDAAVQRGLLVTEAGRTIKSGLDAGVKAPRGLPWHQKPQFSSLTTAQRWAPCQPAQLSAAVAPKRPPRDEVLSLWEAGVSLDDRSGTRFLAWARARAYLAGRGFDVSNEAAAVDVVRCAPDPTRYRYPRWWPPGWACTWNLIALAREPDGTPASLHGRAVIDRPEQPKSRWPRGFKAKGLLFADTHGVAVLKGTPPTTLEGILIVEGLTDTLASAIWAAGQRALRGRDLAVLGISAGGASGLGEVVAWPRGIPLFVATDCDDTGDKYAQAVRMAVPHEMEVRRVRLGSAE